MPAHLIEDENDIDEDAIAAFDTVGVTAGASTPEWIVLAVCEWFRARGVTDIATLGGARIEDVVFRLPVAVAGSPRSGDAHRTDAFA